jgi:hypothetical protein
LEIISLVLLVSDDEDGDFFDGRRGIIVILAVGVSLFIACSLVLLLVAITTLVN